MTRSTAHTLSPRISGGAGRLTAARRWSALTAAHSTCLCSNWPLSAYGLSLPNWFNVAGKSYDQPRNRYNTDAHFDLHDILTNFGAARFNGGLNLAANILGKPGKIDVQGYMVQDLYDEGKIAEINDYCRCDVLDTYFVFLRTMVMLGKLPIEEEQQIVSDTRTWLEERSSEVSAFLAYLEGWGGLAEPLDRRRAYFHRRRNDIGPVSATPPTY